MFILWLSLQVALRGLAYKLLYGDYTWLSLQVVVVVVVGPRNVFVALP